MGWQYRAHGGWGSTKPGEVVDLQSNQRIVLPAGCESLADLVEGLAWWGSVIDDADALVCHASPRLIRRAEETSDPQREIEAFAWTLAGCSSAARAHTRTMVATLQDVVEGYLTHSRSCPLLLSLAQRCSPTREPRRGSGLRLVP